MFDMKDGFRNHRQIVFEKQIKNTNDGAGESILHWRQERVGGTLTDGAKHGIKGGPRHRRDFAAQQLDGSSFAEGARFALKSHAHGAVIGCAHSLRYLAIRSAKQKAEFRPWLEKISRHALSTAPPLSAAGFQTFVFEY
jgi:hypothetical protein